MNVVPNEAMMREQLLLSVAWVREQLRRADIGSQLHAQDVDRGADPGRRGQAGLQP